MAFRWTYALLACLKSQTNPQVLAKNHQKTMKILKTKRSFRKEFKRQIKMAIIAAIGFTIAFVWKESLLQILQKTAENLGYEAGLGSSPLFAPILTTILGVLLIIILSKVFSE
jgi:hypothetical protein